MGCRFAGKIIPVYSDEIIDEYTDVLHRKKFDIPEHLIKWAIDRILMKGTCPIILVLAREMYKQIPSDFQSLLDDNRLLIISISKAVRQSKATALARNRHICEMADNILFVGVTESSSLYPLAKEYNNKTQVV